MGLILRSSNTPNPGDDIIIKNSELWASEDDGNLMYLLTNMSGSQINIAGPTNITGNTIISGLTTIKGHLYVKGTVNATSSWANNTLTTQHIKSTNVEGPNGFNSILNASYADQASKADYADKVDLKTVNGKLIESNVRSINGQTADNDGNIAISLLSTKIGTLDEMNASSADEGTIWIVTDGTTYLFKSGKWVKLPSYNQTATDQRYLKLDGGVLTGLLDMNSNDITNIKSIESNNISTNTITSKEFIGNLTGIADKAELATSIEGGSTSYLPIWSSNNTLAYSALYQNNSNIGIGTTDPQYKLDVNGAGKFNTLNIGSIELNNTTDTLNIKGNISANNINSIETLKITGLKDATSYKNVLSISGLGGKVFNINAETMSTTMSLKLNNSSTFSTWDFIAGPSDNTIETKAHNHLVLKQYGALIVYQTGKTYPELLVVRDETTTKFEVKSSAVTINTILTLPPIDANDLPETPSVGSVATIGSGDKFGVYVYTGKTWKQLAFA